jgi:hypothetical protein
MRPNEIAEVVCHINAEEDHQAHGTPFGSGPLATAIGCHGDTPQAAHLLQGRIPSTAQMNYKEAAHNSLPHASHY